MTEKVYGYTLLSLTAPKVVVDPVRNGMFGDLYATLEAVTQCKIQRIERNKSLSTSNPATTIFSLKILSDVTDNYEDNDEVVGFMSRSASEIDGQGLLYTTYSAAKQHKTNMDRLVETTWPDSRVWNLNYWKTKPEPWKVFSLTILEEGLLQVERN